MEFTIPKNQFSDSQNRNSNIAEDSFLRATRRDFLRNACISALGMTGIGGFISSCAEKGIKPSSDLISAYLDGILSIIQKITEREIVTIQKAAGIAVQARLQGYRLFARLNGGMLPYETSFSRPGSPQIFITENINEASTGDVVVTNDPESVRWLHEQMVKIIGITTPSVVNSETPPYTLENMGKLRIEDIADIIIFCHVPYTDGILQVKGLDYPICPASGLIHSLIYYSLVAEIVDGFTKSGIYPQIG